MGEMEQIGQIDRIREWDREMGQIEIGTDGIDRNRWEQIGQIDDQIELIDEIDGVGGIERQDRQIAQRDGIDRDR